MPRFWNRISYPGWLALEDAVRAAPGRRSSASLAPRSSRFSRPESKPFLQRRQRHWRPITSFRGIAGCSTLEAAPARSCSPSCDGTLRCAALCSSCRVLARWRGVGSQASPRGSGSTWSRETSSVTRCLPDTMFYCSPIRSMCSPPRTISTCCASCVPGGAGHAPAACRSVDGFGPSASSHVRRVLDHSGEGQAYGEYHAEAWLRESGWRKAERRPLGGPHSVIVAEAIDWLRPRPALPLKPRQPAERRGLRNLGALANGPFPISPNRRLWA